MASPVTTAIRVSKLCGGYPATGQLDGGGQLEDGRR